MREKFIEIADDIYYRGMLGFEIICEKICIEYPEEVRNQFQDILDKAQMIFEKSNGK